MSNSSDVSDSSQKDFFLDSSVKDSILPPLNKLSPLDAVKILLRERGMKQSELADKIGMTRQGLHNYLRGEWTVPTQIKVKIAQALGVDSSVIWDLEVKK